MESVILDNTKNKPGGCESKCGEDWSSPETIELVKKQVKARFGDKVKLKYLDLSKTGDRDEACASGLTAHEQDILPVLIIDGNPRISGQFDMRMLLEAISTEMEVRNWGGKDNART